MNKKLGEIFKYEDVTLQVVKNDTCEGCFFSNAICKGILCSADERDDQKNVIFKQIEEMKLKPGMMIELSSDHTKFILVPNKDGVLTGFGLDFGWISDPQALFNAGEILKVGYPEFYYPSENKNFETVIWEKSTKVELTLEQIAKKFEIPVENLKIVSTPTLNK